MKQQRGALTGDTSRQYNFHVKRHTDKHSTKPAIAHGISYEVSSIEVGKWAEAGLTLPKAICL